MRGRDLEYAIPLSYLTQANPAIWEKWQKKFNKSPEELEAILQRHPKKLRYYKILYSLAALSVFPATYLQILLSDEGVKKLMRMAFYTEVSTPFARSIGIPAAIGNAIALASVFSPHVKAMETILSRELGSCRQSTHWKSILKHLISFPTNTTGAMSAIVGFASPLMALRYGERVFAVAPLFLLQWTYYNGLYNDSLEEGIDFIGNKQYPWTFRLESKAMMFQIILQSSSAVLLRALLSYYFVSDRTEKLWGGWFPHFLVVATAALQGLGTLHVATYMHYKREDEDINARLERMHKRRLTTFLRHHNENISEEDLALYLKWHLSLERKKLDHQISKQQTWRQILKDEPHHFVTISIIALIGGTFGYEASALLAVFIDPSLVLSLSCALAGAMFFGEIARRVDFQRSRDISTLAYLKEQTQEHKPELIEIKPGKCERAIKHLATTAAIMGGLSAFIATAGAAAEVIPASAPTIVTQVAVMTAMQRGANTAIFSKGRIRDTWLSWWRGNPEAKKEDSSTSSWCCWRRQR